MSLWQRKQTALGISPTAVALVLVDSATGSAQFHEESYQTHSKQSRPILTDKSRELAAALTALIERHLPIAARETPRVVITDNMARYYMLSPPDGVSCLNELQTIAKARFEEIYEVSAAEWRHTADWQSTGPVVCCSVPENVVDLMQPPPNLVSRFFSVNTLLAILLPKLCRDLPKSCWLCIRLTEYLTLILIHEARIHSIRIIAISADSTEQAAILATAELHRETVRLELPTNYPAFWFDSKPQPATEVPNITVDDICYQRLSIEYPTSVVPKEMLASDAGIAAWLGAL